MSIKVLVLRTAGINCDRETESAFGALGADCQRLHINTLKEKRTLRGYQIICVPGGFSYGDDLGAGKIFSLELLLWFKDQLQVFLAGGGLMIGICNGFQVLVKTGILPDADFIQKVTLTDNDSGRFEDRWVYLRVPQDPDHPARKIWLQKLPPVIQLPVAHGEGKFFAKDDILDTMKTQRQAALQYADAQGNNAGYPQNPNGSLDHIAGITDKTGRILGLMPHPERCFHQHHYPFWHGKERGIPFGRRILENAVEYFK